MVNITIDPQLKEVWQQAALGCVQCRVVVQPSSRQLLEAIDVVCRRLMDSMSIEQIKTREHIAQTRACCTALGKDVKRYRNSAEALNRRVLQGKGLYQINNVVEVNNLISLDTGYSLGSYDLEKLEGDIVWKPAGEGGALPRHRQGGGQHRVFAGAQRPAGIFWKSKQRQHPCDDYPTDHAAADVRLWVWRLRNRCNRCSGRCVRHCKPTVERPSWKQR